MRSSDYSRASGRLFTAGFIFLLAGVVAGLLSLAVRAIPPPLVLGPTAVGICCMLGSQALYLRRLEQDRTTAGSSLTAFYSREMRSWLRAIRAYPMPVILGLGALGAGVLALWLSFVPAVLISGGAVVFWFIIMVIGRMLRW